MFMSRDQNTVRNHSINFYNTLVETWKCLNILEQTQINKCDDIIYIYINLTAIGLTPGGNSTVHIYTNTIHRIQGKEHT
jgi:hypothetical protein